jgi:hypothetical protein
MTRGRLIIAMAAAVCLLAGLLFDPSLAQTRPPADKPGPPQPGGMSAELQETLHLYLIHKLTEELELSDEQTLKLMPLIRERENNRWEYFQSHSERQRELALLLEDEESSEAAMENAISAIRQGEHELHQREAQLNLEIAAQLTTRQYAQFVLFQERFHNEIRQRVKRLRGMEHQGQRQKSSR